MSRSEAILIPVATDELSPTSVSAFERETTQAHGDRSNPAESAPAQPESPESIGGRILAQGDQYLWLGILSKNATFTATTAAILWKISVADAESLLQGWVAQQLVMVSKRWPQSGRSPSKQTYQLPTPLHQVVYQTLIHSGQLSPQQAHATVIERYRAQTQKRLWHTLEDDGYIHAHLTWHLQAANLCDEIHILLQEEADSGANGWYEACDRKGYTAFFCRDLKLAWRLAEQMYGQASTQAMQLQCRYALMTVAHHQVVTEIPANLVAAFVNQQVWTPTQSITYLELIQDSQHRFEVLQALLPALPSTYHRYLLKIIQHQRNCTHQARLLCLFAPYLDSTLFPDLLQIVQAMDTDFYKALVLRAVSATLPINLLEQTLAIAQTLALEDAMVAACGIIDRWPQTASIYLQLLAQGLQGQVDDSICIELLRAIIPAVSDLHLTQVLEHINTFQEPATKVELLILLLPQQPQVLSVIFQTACTIRNEQSFALTLEKIAPYLTEIDVQLALNILENFEDQSAYRLSLKAISLHHPLPHICDKLIKMIETLPSELEQCQAFCDILPNLTPTVQAKIKTRVNAISDPTSLVLSLCHLARRDKTIFPAALHTISLCSDIETQFQAYWILCQHWPKLIPAAFTTACKIETADTQIFAFHQLAPHLTDGQHQQVLEIAKRSEDEDKRQNLLEEIIPYGSQDLLIKIRNLKQRQKDNPVFVSVLGNLKSQLTSSQLKLSPWEARKRALDALTSLLPDQMLHQTLSATFEFSDPVSCAQSLSRLLPQIHFSQVDYSLWCKILHALTALEQDLFLLNLPKLIPMMENLAGPEIHHGMIQNTQMIHRQWQHPSQSDLFRTNSQLK